MNFYSFSKLLFLEYLEMSYFSEKLVSHLSAQLNCKVSDVEKALNSFCGIEPKIEQKTSGSSSSSTSNTCERIRRGQVDPCGKNAKKCIKDLEGVERWYCTPCAKCVETRLKKEREKKASDTIAKEATKPGKKPTQREKKTQADIKSEVLLGKVTRKNNIAAKRYKLKNGKSVYMDRSSRILFDGTRENIVAYAKLNDKDEIEDLEDEEFRFLEALNIPIKTKHKKQIKVENEVEEVEDGDSDEDVIDDINKSKGEENLEDEIESSDNEVEKNNEVEEEEDSDEEIDIEDFD